MTRIDCAVNKPGIRGEQGFLHVIVAILVLIGVFLAVIISLVVGLDRAHQEQFNQSIFDEKSKISEIQKKIDVKAEQLDKTIAAKKEKLAELRRQFEARGEKAKAEQSQPAAPAESSSPPAQSGR